MNETDSYDYLIVGAGISGLTMAQRLCTESKARCLMVDKRDHIGGNCRDYHDEHGVLIHQYGPHYFRTNSDRVREYLSQFTEWHPANYEIKSWTDGRYWSFPINLNTFEEFIGRPSTSEEMIAWLEEHRIPYDDPKNSEEVILNKVGRELYEKFYLGYTHKQWQRHPRELDPSVCGRVPIRTNRDNSCLHESFQALPKDGYSAMFDRMIENCGDRLEIRLKTDYRSLGDSVQWKHMIYTGPIDSYFEYSHGRLPYRSLRFENQSFTPEQLEDLHPEPNEANQKLGFYQPALQVNYPNDHDYTRIVELKHATGQDCPNTTIVREYPADYDGNNEPYYPVLNDDSKTLRDTYLKLAEQEPKVTFIGRLATFRYYNMDQVVGLALAEATRLITKP